MTPTPYGLGQLVPLDMSVPTATYRAAPAIANDGTGVFGTEQQKQAAAVAEQNRRNRFNLEMRVSKAGAGAVVDGINPQIYPDLIDQFSWNYQGGGKVVGFDALLRGPQRPSVVDAANKIAARDKEENTLTWKLNQWVNENPVLALVALAGLWHLTKGAASHLSKGSK
jgi:hypothetical protein